MRKEILLAVIVGITFGLAVTFAIYSIRQRIFKNNTPAEIEERKQQTAQLQPTPTATGSIIIQSPAQDLYTTEDSVQVVGRAKPNSSIVILAVKNEIITSADQDGDFAAKVPLVEGGNKLTLVATEPEGNQETTTLNVVMSTADLEIVASTSATPSPSPKTAVKTSPKPTPTP